MSSFLYPSSLAVMPRGQSGTGPSPGIWDRVVRSRFGAAGGKLVGDDFDYFQIQTAGKYHGEMPYTGYIDTSNTIAQLATGGNLGVVSLLTDATDNDEVWLSPGSATSVLGSINHASGTRGLVAFEARFRVGSVADDVTAIFLGLGEEGLAAADTKADNTGVLADKDYIGFNSVHTNSGTAGTNAKLNFVYNEASGSGPITKIATVQTMVAATFYKVGFVYDPNAVPAKRISVYVDGVEQSTYVTDAAITTSTDFPDGEELNPLFGMKNGSGAIGSLDLDWFYAYMDR
jgi:hypothetical protein